MGSGGTNPQGEGLVSFPRQAEPDQRLVPPGTLNVTTPAVAPGIHAEVAAVLEWMRNECLLSDLSLDSKREEVARYAMYLERVHGVARLRDVTPDQARAYITLPVFRATGVDSPTIATQHIRRSAVRVIHRVARRLGLDDHDPALDIALPSRPSRSTRPLTDDEIALCRSYALSALQETRIPASWALAEATAGTSEQGWIRVSDVDTTGWRIWIHGAAKRRARWGKLTDWGAIQIERRLKFLSRKKDDDPLLLIRNDQSSLAGRVSSLDESISWVLQRAGLKGEPGVRPYSVVAWAGAHALARGATIDEVARMLGVRRLDHAAAITRWSWRSTDGRDLR